jgi:hypothetical protein
VQTQINVEDKSDEMNRVTIATERGRRSKANALKRAVRSIVEKLRDITPEERLRELLKFCQRERRPDDYIWVGVFLLSQQPAPQWRWREGALPAMTPQELDAAASEIRAGVIAYIDGPGWKDRRVARVIQRKNEKSTVRYSGPPAAVLVASAFDLVMLEGPRIRRCARQACEHQILFVPRKRQEYCARRCSLLEGTRKFRESHSKEELYEKRHDLYVAKVKSEAGEATAKKIRQRGPRNSA